MKKPAAPEEATEQAAAAPVAAEGALAPEDRKSYPGSEERRENWRKQFASLQKHYAASCGLEESQVLEGSQDMATLSEANALLQEEAGEEEVQTTDEMVDAAPSGTTQAKSSQDEVEAQEGQVKLEAKAEREELETRLEEKEERLETRPRPADKNEKLQTEPGGKQEGLETRPPGTEDTLETKAEKKQERLETRPADKNEKLQTKPGGKQKGIETRPPGTEDKLETKAEKKQERLETRPAGKNEKLQRKPGGKQKGLETMHRPHTCLSRRKHNI